MSVKLVKVLVLSSNTNRYSNFDKFIDSHNFTPSTGGWYRCVRGHIRPSAFKTNPNYIVWNSWRFLNIKVLNIKVLL